MCLTALCAYRKCGKWFDLLPVATWAERACQHQPDRLPKYCSKACKLAARRQREREHWKAKKRAAREAVRA